MVRKGPYRIDYSPDALDHLRSLTARQAVTVLDTVERQLSQQPTVWTRNRKVLRANPVAPYELRAGELRVYYEAGDEPSGVVIVKAVGVKDRACVRIGGEEVEL